MEIEEEGDSEIFAQWGSDSVRSEASAFLPKSHSGKAPHHGSLPFTVPGSFPPCYTPPSIYPFVHAVDLN